MKDFKQLDEYLQIEETAENRLFKTLSMYMYTQYPYSKQNLGDGMYVIEKVISEYWKPRFLIDEKNNTAVAFMDDSTTLQTICTDDIDWESLEGLPQRAVNTAKALDAVFPIFIREYKNGMAKVSWEINPDGFYYMNEDGFGMTDDEEITIYSYVDRAGKPLVKFRAIKDSGELEKMEKEARQNLKMRK